MTNEKTPSNGETDKVKQPEVVNISLFPTGDLVEAFVFGIRAREDIVANLQMAQAAAGQNQELKMSIEFQANFKEAQGRLAQAKDGCEKIKAEINQRFQSTDAMRFALVKDQSTEA